MGFAVALREPAWRLGFLLMGPVVVMSHGQTALPAWWPVRDPGIVTTQQAVTPAGATLVVSGPVHGVEFDGAGMLWALTQSALYRVDWERNRVENPVSLGGTAGFQAIRIEGETGWPYVAKTISGGVELRRWSGTGWAGVGGRLGATSVGSPALVRRGGGGGGVLAVVPLPSENRLAVVDLDSGRVVGRPVVGQAPFGVVADRAGMRAWVSLWGGRLARAGEAQGGAQGVLVDSRGIASSGAVVELDLQSLEVRGTVELGLHPTAMAWDQGRNRLYVALSNGDGVAVVDTETHELLARWPVGLGDSAAMGTGVTPTAVALSPDGGRLYVASAGVNAVAVMEIGSGAVKGWIPTAWYPASVAVSGDGRMLAVGSLLGAGAGGDATRRRVTATRGGVSVVPVPDEQQLADYTSVVMANNRVMATGGGGECGQPADPIPHCVGQKGPIEHVVLVIKENRTYDQVLGDLGKGNGNPALVMYGERVTPNQHALADGFVTLDNLYATGGVSAEGHLWLTQAYAPSYVHWRGYEGRSYPFDGTDPLAYSPRGFLWDAARAAGKTVRVFGEFVPAFGGGAEERQRLLSRWEDGGSFDGMWRMRAQVPSLNEVLVADYPSYGLHVPDVVRARIFQRELDGWTREGVMPNLVIAQLPGNHTMGTMPGWPTPRAMVAENDYALGLMVEGLTRSPFWGKMAIFVVEDDSQDGVDHVDGHRTVGQVVSPWAARRSVDSTFYSHQSILKTIELILGLAPMTMFDLIATDMRAAFTTEADFAGYAAVRPEIDLSEVNPRVEALRGQARRDAVASQKMDWKDPDEAPTAELNRILWRAAKGEAVRYPERERDGLRPWVPGRGGR